MKVMIRNNEMEIRLEGPCYCNGGKVWDNNGNRIDHDICNGTGYVLTDEGEELLTFIRRRVRVGFGTPTIT